MLEAIQAMDETILLFIQENIRGGFLNSIMVFFTTIGNAGAVWILLSILLLCMKKYRRAGLAVLLVMGLSWCVNDLLIKSIAARPRPFLAIEGLEVLVSLPQSWSFPSGHTCSSFAAAYVLTRELGKKGALSYILAVLIALSRPYVGVHYMSDVFVGALVGTLCSVFFYAVICKIFNRWQSGRAEKC